MCSQHQFPILARSPPSHHPVCLGLDRQGKFHFWTVAALHPGAASRSLQVTVRVCTDDAH